VSDDNDDAGQADSTGEADAPVEDEQRRRFREALERKQHRSGVNRSGHGPDRQDVPAGNDKRRQNFRRKSGGGG
jgi:hypothetical protein